MTEKELRKLSRRELLEMLLDQSKRTENLRNRLSQAEENLNSRDIEINESGSIADAALKINGVFEAAQKASDDYLEKAKRIEAEAHIKYDEIVGNANRDAKAVIAEANAMKAEAAQLLDDARAEADWLRKETNDACVEMLKLNAAEMEKKLEIMKACFSAEDTDNSAGKTYAPEQVNKAPESRAEKKSDRDKGDEQDSDGDLSGQDAEDREFLATADIELKNKMENRIGEKESDVGKDVISPEKTDEISRIVNEAEKNKENNHMDFDFLEDDGTEDFEAVDSITETIDVSQIRASERKKETSKPKNVKDGRK